MVVMRKESEFTFCRTVGSNTALPFAMATVGEAVTSESRKELTTQALSEPFRYISAPKVQKEGMSTTESASVAQALSKSFLRTSPSHSGAQQRQRPGKKECRPLRVLQSLEHSPNRFCAHLRAYG